MVKRKHSAEREVYMAGRRKKTSLSERKKIVEYCLSYGKNYKDAAARYDVSYSQVYDWVRKYAADWEAALIAGAVGRKVIFDIPSQVESAGFSKATKARLDSKKLQSLGWKAQYDIKDGITRTIRILRECDNQS